LTNMLVTMVSSMWISNVAAPVLSYSIVQVCAPPPIAASRVAVL
jgi:di/tricarboxylate transporter